VKSLVLADAGKNREPGRVNPAQVTGKPTTFQIRGLSGRVQIEFYRPGRQLFHQVHKRARRESRRAVRFHLGVDPAGQTDFEIGGGQLEPTTLGRQQDICQDGQNRFCSGGMLDDG